VHSIDRRPISVSALNRAVDLIRSKRKPLIVCGGGVHYSLATEPLVAFAEAFSIPVAETQAGKSAVPWNHPLSAGAIGVTGSLAANVLARDADLIIAVGTRLTDFSTASKAAFGHPEVSLLSINVSGSDSVKMNALPVLA